MKHKKLKKKKKCRHLWIVLRPLLPMTKESSFRSSMESKSFSLTSPQYNFTTTLTYESTKLTHKAQKLMANAKNLRNRKIRNLFLSGGSVKQIKDLSITVYAIVLQNLCLSELTQRNKSCKDTQTISNQIVRKQRKTEDGTYSEKTQMKNER